MAKKLFETERNQPLTTAEGAINFLNWGKQLGPNISLGDIYALQDSNRTVLQTLERIHGEKLGVVTTARACIIPAHNEQSLELLLDLAEDAEQGTEPLTVIVAINGEGTNESDSITFHSTQNLKPSLNKYRNIDVIPLLLPGQGKLYAHHQAIEHLNSSHLLPQKIAFFDADSRLSPGGLDALFDPISEQITAASIGVEIPELEDTEPHYLSRLLHRAMVTPQNVGGDKGYLQGGAFSLHKNSFALYQSFTECFPGLVAVDLVWTSVLKSLNKCIHIDARPYNIRRIDDNSFDKILKQHNRWVQGLLEEFVFLRKGTDAHSVDLVKDSIKQRMQNYFPRFPHVKAEEIGDTVRGLLTDELPLAGYISALCAATILFPKPIKVMVNQSTVEIGGPPPNIYMTRGWEPPRIN